MVKIFGFVPARMAASRFPGKPLHPINGRPLLEHCFERAKLFEGWDGLFLATCDAEIKNFGEQRSYSVVMTSSSHIRALDRIAEAADICGIAIAEDDIVVCVQGDEPLLGPDVIQAVIRPLEEFPDVQGTVLSVPIIDEVDYRNPDIVKIIHDRFGDILYTSRSPVPYSKNFSDKLGALRVGGIFGFRFKFLKWFTEQDESPLELIESCDSNRILDNGRRQRIAPIDYRPYFSVDSPDDIKRVEAAMAADSYTELY